MASFKSSYQWIVINPFQEVEVLFMDRFLINSSLIMLSSLFCVLLGGFFLFNSSLSRLLVIYSSLSFSGWLILSLIISSFILLGTFLIYFGVIFILFKEMFLPEDLWFYLNNFVRKEKILFILFSLGGIPPLLGFIPKWLIFLSFTILRFFCGSILIILSLLNIFCYLKIFSILLISKTSKEKLFWVIIFFNILPLMIIIFLGP